MLQTSLLLMKSLNKTETPIFSLMCPLFPKTIFSTYFIYVCVRLQCHLAYNSKEQYNCSSKNDRTHTLSDHKTESRKN